MAYGVTSAGFVPKPLAVIQAELQASYQAVYGAGVNLSPSSVNGQMIGVLSDRESQLWALCQALYNALDPDVASDVAFDNILALTGLQRLGATKSTALLVCVGSDGFVVPQGAQVATSAGGTPFLLDADCLMSDPVPWTALSTPAQYSFRTNDSGRVYMALNGGGTTAASGGPTGNGTAIVDGTVVWRFIDAGVAVGLGSCTARDFGPTPAVGGAITTIVTPVAGLTEVLNPFDAAVGRAVETDAQGRIRRNAALHSTGNAAADAVRAAILSVSGVTSCNLLVNDGDLVDGNSLLPHSIEAIVQGGLGASVAAAVFKKSAGIATGGNTFTNVVDSQGNTQVMRFTRPTPKNIYVAVTATLGSTFDATNGPARVKANLVSFALGTLLDAVGRQIFAGYKPGDTVVQSALYQAVFKEPGISDITALLIGVAPSPVSSANITALIRELASFDTSRITFNGV